MSLSVLYHPNSGHERSVLDWQRDFKAVTGHELELISLETREGAELAKLYAVDRYPAILARREDGELLQLWQGEDWPLFNELSAYAN